MTAATYTTGDCVGLIDAASNWRSAGRIARTVCVATRTMTKTVNVGFTGELF